MAVRGTVPVSMLFKKCRKQQSRSSLKPCTSYARMQQRGKKSTIPSLIISRGYIKGGPSSTPLAIKDIHRTDVGHQKCNKLGSEDPRSTGYGDDHASFGCAHRSLSSKKW